MVEKEWLSPAEVAVLLNISRWTVYRRLIGQNVLRASRVGSQWRINQKDIAAYMENQRKGIGEAAHGPVLRGS